MKYLRLIPILIVFLLAVGLVNRSFAAIAPDSNEAAEFVKQKIKANKVEVIGESKWFNMCPKYYAANYTVQANDEQFEVCCAFGHRCVIR